MQLSLFKPPFIAFFSSFVYISRDEDMQFSQPLQFIVPSFSPLIHSFFHQIPVCGICIYTLTTSCSLKHIPTTLLLLPTPQTCCFRMESSPCLFSPPQTPQSVKINTHGGALEGADSCCPIPRKCIHHH